MAEMEHNRVKEGMRTAMAPLAEERERLIAAYNAIPYEYTARTIRRIRRLFRMQKVKAFGKTAAQWGKRAAVIVLVLLTLALAACVAIKPLREKLANAFLTWYDEYVEIHYENSAEDIIEKSPQYIPNDYELMENIQTSDNLMLTYVDSSGNYLDFSRIKTEENTHMNFDNSDYTVTQKNVDGVECIFICSNEDECDNMITWSENGFMYRIAAYLPIEELIKIVENVR